MLKRNLLKKINSPTNDKCIWHIRYNQELFLSYIPRNNKNGKKWKSMVYGMHIKIKDIKACRRLLLQSHKVQEREEGPQFDGRITQNKKHRYLASRVVIPQHHI